MGIPAEVYTKIGLDPLLVYAVKRVQDAGEECTFERLVYECFTSFPLKFGFARYSDWPDARSVEKSWLRCRTDKGWLLGNAQEGFQLTHAGQLIAEEVEQKLNAASLNKIAHGYKTRGKEESIIRYISNSEAFKKWRRSPFDFSISESEFRSLLNTTLETSRTVLRQNFRYYLEMAHLLNKSEVVDFLNTCADQHQVLLRGR